MESNIKNIIIENLADKVNSSLEENISFLSTMFKNDLTIKHRRFRSKDWENGDFALFFVDGMVSNTLINDSILSPIMMASFFEHMPDEKREKYFDSVPICTPLDYVAKYVLTSNDLKESSSMKDLIQSLLSGDTLLFANGATKGLSISTKGWSVRSIQEPDSERVMQGPREGFTEAIMVNLSLIRRKIKSPDLRYHFMVIGKQTNTNVCVCYMDGIADPKMIQTLKTQLGKINIDGILDTNYVEELIKENIFSSLKTTGSTERPDIVAAKLLEGHAAVIVDGTPVALTAPFIFLEYFQSNDDYYTGFYFGSFGRLLRILGFILTISVPAIYLAMITFHQEMIPTKFLININESRDGLPFSSLFEMIILILAFELLREGGSKVPSSIGSTLSIVGGLVLGQASVDAKFVSIPIVIIVAFTGITGLMIPQLKGPVLLLRIVLLLLSSILGIYGYMIGILLFLLHISTLESYGVPYTSLLSRNKAQVMTDTFVRGPWNFMKFRPKRIAPTNKIRQKANDDKGIGK